MILTIRTDKPEAEIGLYDESNKQLAYKKWQAHRLLSETILVVIKEMLDSNDKNFDDIKGVIFYEGPGSFTGLRIGASVANALQKPTTSAGSEDWINIGMTKLKNGENGLALPSYGADAHITKPKK